MIPVWVKALSSLAPFLLLISAGTIVFGYVRLKRHLQNAKEEQQEEERKRQEFLKSMAARLPTRQAKIPDAKLKH